MALNVFSLLSEKLSGKKSPPAENFLALKIAKDSVAATFWQIVSGKVQIGNVAVSPITSDSPQGLLAAVDEVVSKVGVNVTPEPKKIIFGVNEDWIADGKLFPEKLIELRKLCRELDLSPMGFVAMNEAVENLLRESDGVPPTALLIGIDKDRIYVTLLKAGKNLGTFWEDYVGNLAESLEKAIRKFTGVDFLPARMVIYDGRSDLEEIKQKIVAYPWTQKLSFLHFPKVEVLETSGAVKAVAAAGGTQLGGQLDLSEMEWLKEDKEEKYPVSTVPAAENEEAVEKPKDHELSLEKEVPLAPSIVEPESHADLPESKLETSEPHAPAELEEVDPSELGFQSVPDEKINDEDLSIQGTLEDLPVSDTFPTRKTKLTMPKMNLPKFNLNLAPVLSKLSFVRPERNSPVRGSKKLPLILVVILLFLVLFVGALVYFLPSATITVFVKPIEINKTLDLALQSGQSVATSAAVISGKTVDITLSQTKKGAATGKKLVGTRAKGTITIYNSNGAKNFPAGTSVSTNGLKFQMDADVSLASSSGLASQSTATVSVTAGDIGDNYNIAAGSLFSIAGLPTSSYQGKNDSAFSGGSSHQATVVSKDDQTRLLATASAELDSSAKEQLQTKLGSGETLLDKAITSKVDKKKFSKDVDAEADSLTLDLSVIYTGLVFDQKDGKTAFAQSVSSQIPADYELPLDNIEGNLVKVNTLKNGTNILIFNFSGRAMPVIDRQKLLDSAAGKKISQFVGDIKNNGVDHTEVTISPNVFEKLNFLPFQKSKIKLEVVSL